MEDSTRVDERSVMDDYCLVVSGEWRCNNANVWEFSVNTSRLSRFVDLNLGRTLNELEDEVLREFGFAGGNRMGIVLSYLPRSSAGRYYGPNTPPVVLGSDTGLKFYKKMRSIDNELGLYVKFEEDKKSLDLDAELGFLTPKPGRKRGLGLDTECGSSKSVMKKINAVNTSVTEGLTTEETSDYIDDEALLDHLQTTEEKMRKESATNLCPERKVFSECDGEETDVDETDEYVSPRPYDRTFWDNFIDEVDGGSNAVEVMCTTNDAFDHRVLLGGGPVDYKPSGRGYPEDVQGPVDSQPSFSLGADLDENVAFGYGGTPAVGESRNLGDIDDEEFDIPPLYDDCDYVRHDEIPDLDYECDDGRIYKGKLYHSKQDCQIALAIYAIKQQFRFKQTRTDRKYFVLNCADPQCDWRIMAHECKNSSQYSLRKISLEHTCNLETRSEYMKNATSKVIASVYKSKFVDTVSGPMSMDLQQLVLEDLRVSASYMKCWRARNQAIVSVRGTDDESYKKLADYLYLLKLENPGTVTDLVTDVDDEGAVRFKFMFLAFGASIKGFRHLRLVLVMDGTHFYGKFKGVLLTASGQDANFQVFPLAYAVVDSKNDESWTWFFQKVERIVADSKQLTIISDRCQSIYNAKARVFPLANHAACLVHLQRNVVAKFKNKGLSKLVGKAARAYRLGRFKELFGEVKSISKPCGNFLETVGMAHWTRFYFQGDRYNLMTSNIAETLNKALLRGRSSPIVELLMFIQSMMTRWFNARRRKSERHRGIVTIEVDKVMTKNKKYCKGKEIREIDAWSAQVIGSFCEKNTELLKDKRCTCKRYDREQIPCGHALMFADSKNMDNGSLCADFYKTVTWRATYEGVIKPHAEAADHEVPAEEQCRDLLPPRARRPSGRPKESRIPSTGEIAKGNNRVAVNRCGKCKGVGHNRATCTKKGI